MDNAKAVLLMAVNARYIHSNPAICSLYGACEDKESVALAEYTINHPPEKVLADIYGRHPQVLACSCYIWNITYIEKLLWDLIRVMPDLMIWLGGPEVSYDGETVLSRLPFVKGVMVGEGENTFSRLVSYYRGTVSSDGEPSLRGIPGLVFRENGQIISTGPPEPADMDALPFFYESLPEDHFANRIIYYESGRGCPFRCSYCLSSIDRRVRFRDLALVKRELAYFLEKKVPQVKFIDRTFNCDRARALEIWRWIREHYNGVTNFHFEIAADLLDEASIQLLGSMPAGAVQLEIGVQTVNPDTLREIRRHTDMDRLFWAVRKLVAAGNVHCHLDLIAGLPCEDYESFRHSFDVVYELRPHQLQLGFLKVLKGSYMEEKAADYGLRYSREAPYEVLSTRWLSFGQLIRLKAVEEMVELYANSGQFLRTLPVMIRAAGSPFSFFEGLAAYYKEKGYSAVSHSRVRRYEILREYYIEKLSKKAEAEDDAEFCPAKITELLVLDLYAREAMKSRPAWAPSLEPWREEIRGFYIREEKERRYLKDYEGCTAAQLRRMTHLEVLSQGRAVLFDYRRRNPVTGNAEMIAVDRGLENQIEIS